MPHRHDHFNTGIAEVDKGAPERDRFGAHRHAAEVGVEINASEEFAGTCTHGGADFLPVVAVALADRVGGGVDQFLVFLAQHD